MDPKVYNLAEAAANLVVATDGREELRAERAAVLAALTALSEQQDGTTGED